MSRRRATTETAGIIAERARPPAATLGRVADLGRAALIVAFGLALYAALAGGLAAYQGRRRLHESARNALFGAFGATAVAAYSLRARDGLPVSMPIEWSALRADVRGAHFNWRNVPSLIARRRDPWAGFEASRGRLRASMLRLLK